MLGSALNVTMARGLIGRKVEIVKAREQGTVTMEVVGVFPASADQTSPTEEKPLLLKGMAYRPNGVRDFQPSFAAVWPGSQIDVVV